MRRHDCTSDPGVALEALEPRLLLSASYAIADLGTLGGTSSHAHAINESGQVVGYAMIDATRDRAFLWAGAGLQDLGTLGGGRSWANGINDSGEIVGWAHDATGQRPFYRNAAGTMREIPLPLAGWLGSATGINDAGVVIGRMAGAGEGRGFFWDDTSGDGVPQVGEVQGIASLGGLDTQPNAINDAGVIVGWSEDAFGLAHAFYKTPGGAVTSMTSRHSAAMGINNAGQAVGWRRDGAGNERSFVGTASGLSTIGTLGGDDDKAHGINDSGAIVGRAQLPGGTWVAYVYDSVNNMVNLNDLIPGGAGWSLRSATDINERGQIAGYGEVGGQMHAFLLTPQAPDLVGQWGPIIGPTVPLPGDEIELNLIVGNEGFTPAADTIGIRIYASANKTLEPADDYMLVDLDQVAVDIAVGDTQTVQTSFVLPPDLGPGLYHILADIDYRNDIDEGNEMNNLVSTNIPRPVFWVFGNYGGRKKIKLEVEGNLGNMTTFSLRGTGWGEVYPGGMGFERVRIHGTDTKSSATIKTDRGVSIHIEDVTVSRALKSFTAKTATVRGDFAVNESLDKLVLDGLSGAVVNVLNTAGSDKAAKVTLDQVRDSQITFHQPVRSLTATEWLDAGGPADGFTGESLGTLKIKGDRRRALAGHFEADVTLSGAGVAMNKNALGSAKIAGDLHDATWDVCGNVGKVTVRGQARDWYLSVHSSVKSIKIGRMTHCDIEVEDAIGKIQTTEWTGGGTVVADVIKSVKATGDRRAGISGDLYPHITVEGTSVPAGKDALGTVTAAGVIPGRIMVRGNVKSITAGCLLGARLLIGFDAGLGLLEPCRLKSLTLKGTRFWMDPFDSFFRGATLAAYTIGKIKFAKPPHEASGLVRYHELGRVQHEPLPAGDTITWDLI